MLGLSTGQSIVHRGAAIAAILAIFTVLFLLFRQTPPSRSRVQLFFILVAFLKSRRWFLGRSMQLATIVGLLNRKYNILRHQIDGLGVDTDKAIGDSDGGDDDALTSLEYERDEESCSPSKTTHGSSMKRKSDGGFSWQEVLLESCKPLRTGTRWITLLDC